MSDMPQEVTIDDQGRIVVPKPIRDRLGLSAGSTLKVTVSLEAGDDGSITLIPAKDTPVLQQKGDLLVHTGRLADAEYDVVDHLREQREQRSQQFSS